MDSSEEYEDETDAPCSFGTRVLLEHGYAVGGYEEEVERHSSTSEDGDDCDGSPLTTCHSHLSWR